MKCSEDFIGYIRLMLRFLKICPSGGKYLVSENGSGVLFVLDLFFFFLLDVSF